MHVEFRHGLDELRQLGRAQRDARMRIRVQAIVLAKQGRTAVEIGRYWQRQRQVRPLGSLPGKPTGGGGPRQRRVYR